MSTRFALLFLLVGCGGESTEAPAPAPAAADPAPEAPAPAEKPKGKLGIKFITPKDGSTVKSPVHVKFAVKGKTVEKAGEVVDGTGHHHVIVDGSFVEEGQAGPATTVIETRFLPDGSGTRVETRVSVELGGALGRLGEDEYHVLINNCEHFAHWAATGEKRSPQVQRALAMAALLTAGLTGLGIHAHRKGRASA